MRSRLLWQTAPMILAMLFSVDQSAAQQRGRAGERDREVDREGSLRGATADWQQESDRRDRAGESRRADPRLLPPRPDRDRYWYLGVEVQYRDHGAQITHVERQSPARRAGLEERDVIVTVNGYQVGRVLGRLYPLDRELELRADQRGHVVLLVHNHRNGQLTPLPVRLEPAERRRPSPRSRPLAGTISMRDSVTLPRGAVLTVRLLDVTDRRLPARTIAQRTYRELGPLPIPFELTYEADQVELGRKYGIEAEVTVNGFAALRTPERYSVFESPRQGRVNMLLEPVRR